MKRRLQSALVLTAALACLLAGRPWLLFGQEGELFVRQRWATAQDLTPGPAFSDTAESGAVQSDGGQSGTDAGAGGAPGFPDRSGSGGEPVVVVGGHHDGDRGQAPGDGEKWSFTADRVVAQHDSEYIEAEGEATVRKGKNVLRADFIRYYKTTGWILLRGNVRALWEGDFLEAEEAEFDLRSKVGWLKQGKVFVAKPHLYFESEYVRKYSGDTYQFENAKVTACSGQTPDWSFTAEEGEIVIDGTARLWHTAFNILDVPVAYLPYIEVPASGERQSGFLFPEISSSGRFGLQINLPYYWVISEEADATFYQNWMSKRGYMQGLELRLALDTHTKGIVRFDWLNDAKTYASHADEDELVGGDGLLRPNHNRWWLRSKYDGYLGTPSWRFMADVDLVSDQDYLTEFNQGYSGYEESRDTFVEEFGRGINPADDEERENVLLATRDYQDFSVSGKAVYTQNLAYFNGNAKAGENPTVQRLPELSAHLFKTRVGETPLEFEAGSSLSYFAREYGESGGRFTLEPTLSLPVQTPWMTLIPRVGASERVYFGTDGEDTGNQTIHTGAREDGNATDDGFSHLFTVEAGVSAFTEIYRIYGFDPGDDLALTEENVGNEAWTGLKHSIIPRVDYSYEPTLTGLADKPYYDRMDRPGGTNQVTYSLTNVLDRKVDTVSLVAQGDSVAPAVSSDYLDFLRFRLEQSYDINEADREDELDRYDRRPFSDLMAELVLKPTAGLSLSAKTYYSFYDRGVTEHESEIRFEEPDVGAAFLSFDYLDSVDEYKRKLDSPLSMLGIGGELYLTSNLVMGAEYRVDLLTGRDVEKTLRFTWVDECWNLTLQYTHTQTDHRFSLGFKLFEF